ncbi:hypothetical protein [Paenibacillus sp. Marseille-Q4541]|uniref:hypothetical protein n=1 Tax=Paenibacillus sp. Marseille-Q4541 TaxID=2831522 RepID=UPI001BA79D73|nr:hypothetical protein [Paenibacillus sp. Marseille-Q4541]
MANKKEEQALPLHEQTVMTNQLAAIVGKTPRWINQLHREGVLTQEGRGKYVLGKSIQDYMENLLGGKEDSKKPKLIDYKTEHEKTKAEKARLELEQIKGRLHDAAQVEMLLSDLILTTKSRLLAIPSRIATECENESASMVEEVVKREIETALASLAKYTPGQDGGEFDHGNSSK